MNERIEKLAEQVGAVRNVMAMGRHDGVLFTETELEKFAELIVKECMDIIVEQTTLDENEDFREGFSLGRKLVWMEIRHRFGVEE